MHCGHEDTVLLEQPLIRSDPEEHICDFRAIVAIQRNIGLILHVGVAPDFEPLVRWLLLFWQIFVLFLEVHVTPPHARHERRTGADIDYSRRSFRAALSSFDQLGHDEASE